MFLAVCFRLQICIFEMSFKQSENKKQSKSSEAYKVSSEYLTLEFIASIHQIFWNDYCL